MKLKLSAPSILAFLLLFSLNSCFLQTHPRRALRQLKKENYTKSEKLLRKALEKDSLNPAAYWLFSRLYLDTAHQQHIDTAHFFALKALQQAPLETARDQKRWRKLGLDSASLSLQHSLADSAAFARASTQHTVAAYQYFLDRFADAPQLSEARERRNALAFAATEAMNTWQAYQQFFQTYPQARQANEARERYEELLFKERTRTGTLQAYHRFLAEHPQTPYRNRLLRNIYRLSTANHDPYSYYQFIRKHPDNPYTQQALLQLYYLHGQPATLWQKYSELPQPDSLVQLSQRAGQHVIAVLKEGKWGFISEEGQQLLPPKFDDVHPDYLCESLEHDVLEVFSEGRPQLLSWNGRSLLERDYEAVEVLGNALLRVQQAGRQGLMLMGGQWLLQPDYSAIRPLGPNLLLVHMDEQKGLLAPNGLWLLNPQADSLARLQDFVLRFRDSLIAVHGREGLIEAAQENQRLSPNFAYRSVKLLSDSLLLGMLPDSSWQVLTPDLTMLASGRGPQPQALGAALLVPQPEGYQLLNRQGSEVLPGRYQQVVARNTHWAVKQQGRWSLWQMPGKQPLTPAYDSLMVLNPQVVWYRNAGRDSLLFLKNQMRLPLQTNEGVRLLRPQHVPDSLMSRSEQWEKVVTSTGKSLRIYNLQGKLLLQGRYEEVQAPDPLLLILKNERGLFTLSDTSGQQLSKVAYEGIGNYQKGYLALLKGNRFGTLNPYRQVLIGPQFDAAPRPYNPHLLLASKSKKWGLIDHKGKPLLPHRYQSIRFWTDSLALVRENNEWQLLNLYNGQALLSEIIEIDWLRDPAHPKGGMAIVETNAGYGIASTGNGILALPTYHDIQNLGTAESPLFYLEHHNKDTGLYEVTYLNERGNTIFQNTYSQAEWELLLCD